MAKKNALQKRVEAFKSGQEKLLASLKFNIMYVVEFPNHAKGKLPILSRIALNIVNRQGGRIGIRLVDISKK
jgi:uncharacterized protein YbgA (DUF1722 family)